MNQLQHQILSLSASIQASYLINNLATNGVCAIEQRDTLIESLFVTNSINTLDIYQNPKNLNFGLQQLQNLLKKEKDINKEPIKYSIQTNILAKKITKTPQILQKINTEITNINNNKFFLNTHPNSILKLADLYKATASRLSPTILISGKQEFLSNEEITNQIRMLLLSSIRALILWQSYQGRAWKLFFNKNKILETISVLRDN
ncbi:FIG002903: a protein of unknown function perhaps involved in purine metabolism [hydrothermal vent metagenome]|uniref:High frequency lysogenization protein HflD n=1 Tax=hydrothermal vent metagenome TaxID=652676 RepID=A0A1W1BX00_9ZZZZ